MLEKIASTIRSLSMDAIEKANSGHPGLPLGCAEIAAYLYGRAIKHNPNNPKWINRDRFVLSAGHGSIMLYSCLHLAGFDISMDDLKSFRQLNSKTAGHPEYSDGIEATTGPLGQGFGNGVGQALGLKILAERFNTKEHKIFDSTVFVLAGDGCIMEGISSEVSSLAGHLKLDNLIVIYDSNDISLDGPLSQSFSDNVKKRYQAYHWEVFEINGHSCEEIDHAITSARRQEKPCLIIAKTIIGKGSPKAGSNKVHGSPLNREEIEVTKKALQIPSQEFFVPKEVANFFKQKLKEDDLLENEWQKLFSEWKKENPQKSQELERMKALPKDLEEKIKNIEIQSPIASRGASHVVLQELADILPGLYGGSADLSSSDQTFLDKFPFIKPRNFSGRNIKYGVREFGMAAMTTGLAQTDLMVPFCGTFLVFSDYMRNAIRMAAMQKLQVIYQFTHDSFLLGEDGPTHQPMEHLASLRAIPSLQVIRPADSNEVKMAWLAALKYSKGPTAIILSRQKLEELPGTKTSFEDGLGKGAYIIYGKEFSRVDYTIFATGSEVKLALKVAEKMENARVVSMPCWELFEKQTEEYKNEVMSGKRVSIEAGSELGWHKYIGSDGIAISMKAFGASAPAEDLAKKFGFTVEDIITTQRSKEKK